MLNQLSKKPKVFLVCSGLGRISRGFETFTRECFNQFKDSPDFELFLLKGGGKNTANEIVIHNLHRESRASIWFSRLANSEPYFIEQFSFCLGMLPYIIIHRPDLIYFSDFTIGASLWNFRKLFKFKYRLLFSNGAPNGPPFSKVDHIQQLLPLYMEQGIKGNTALHKQTLLPYAIKINLKKNLLAISDSKWYKKKLSLPLNKKIIISVGAVNSTHKRMDYVIREFSKMDSNKYFLIVLGQFDGESNGIVQLAGKTLLNDSFIIRQVPDSEMVMSYLFACDYFVLASLREGMPRVLAEALSAGLIPIVHDYDVARESLRNFGVFKDLTTDGMLKEGIEEVERIDLKKESLILFCYQHYSWEFLKEKYRVMILKLLRPASFSSL